MRPSPADHRPRGPAAFAGLGRSPRTKASPMIFRMMLTFSINAGAVPTDEPSTGKHFVAVLISCQRDAGRAGGLDRDRSRIRHADSTGWNSERPHRPLVRHHRLLP